MSNSSIGFVLACLVLVIAIGFAEINNNLEQQNTEICNASPTCYSSSVSSSVASSISSSEASVSTSIYCSSLSSNTVGNASGAVQYLGSQCQGSANNLVAAIGPILIGIAAVSMIAMVVIFNFIFNFIPRGENS